MEAEASKRSRGFVVSKTQAQSKLFKNLKLRRGDKVRRFNNRPIKSYKQFVFYLKKLKSKSKFRILVIRKNKRVHLDYLFTKGRLFSKTSYKLLKVSHAKKPKKITKSEKLFNKYRHKLQSAYTLQVEAFIYDHPDFDAKKIHSLRPGYKIIISKKIYYPVTRFGSFYKVYIKKPRKIVGYISEIDVIPEFKKTKGEYVANPRFAMAEKYKGKIGQISSRESKLNSYKSSSFLKRTYPSFLGISFFGEITSGGFNIEERQTGIYISSHKISDLTLDINAVFSNRPSVALDIFAVYERIHLINQVPLRLGLGFRVEGQDFNTKASLGDFLFMGLAGLRFPIHNSLFLAAHFQYGYGTNLLKRTPIYSAEASLSLQIPF